MLEVAGVPIVLKKMRCPGGLSITRLEGLSGIEPFSQKPLRLR